MCGLSVFYTAFVTDLHEWEPNDDGLQTVNVSISSIANADDVTMSVKYLSTTKTK